MSTTAETITCDIGKPATYDLALTRSDKTTPIDLTGAYIWMTCKRSEDLADSAAEWQLSRGSGLSVTDEPNGRVRATVTAAQTGTLSRFVTYFVDVVVRETDADPEVVWTGTLTASQPITRAPA